MPNPDCTPNNVSKIYGPVIAPTPSQQNNTPPPTPSNQNMTKSHKMPAGGYPAATPTVTNTNTAVPLADMGQVTKGDVDTQAALPFRAFGPYPQTLFLGCSVVNFNVNLGWGAQSSQLTVTLAEDRSPHYSLSYEALLDRPSQGTTYKAAAQGAWSVDNHYYNVMRPLIGESATSHKNRILSFLDINGNPIIPGKIFYFFNGTDIVQKYWTGPDPGFIADRNRFKMNGSFQRGKDPFVGMLPTDPDVFLGTPVDIIGCPVHFHVDDFVFNGIVKSWKMSGDQNSNRQYIVEIEGPSTIVENAQLILSHYHGSIFNKAGGMTNDGLQQVSGPHNHIMDPAKIPYNSFVGKLSEGNMPNVINIYGFLESLSVGGFGGANLTENGIPTVNIIAALNYLLGRPQNFGGGTRTGLESDNMFNPYGCLISRTPQSIYSRIQPGLPYEIFDFTKCPMVDDMTYTMPQLSAASLDRTSACAPDPKKANQGTCPPVGTFSDNVEAYDDAAKRLSHAGDFTTDGALSTRGNYKIWDFGLISPDFTSDGIARQVYFLDLLELPIPPQQIRTQVNGDSVTSINQLVGNICANEGYEYFWELLYVKIAGKFRKVIKLRTVSRRQQPSNTAVKDYINIIHRAGVPISSLNLGVEYSEATPRALIIGDKQRRLYQVKNCMVPFRTNNYLYNVAINSFVHYEDYYNKFEERNKYRGPAKWSTRESAAIIQERQKPSLKTTRINEIIKTDFNQNDAGYAHVGAFTAVGNYEKLNILNIPSTGNPVFRIMNAAPPGPMPKQNQKFNPTPCYPCLYTGGYEADTTACFPAKDTPCPPKTSNITGGNNSDNQQYTAQDATGKVTNTTNPEGNIWTLAQTIISRAWELGKQVINTLYNCGIALNTAIAQQILGIAIVNPTALGTRFHPMSLNVICPYFGYTNFYNDAANFDLKSVVKRPRPVYLDKWTNQFVVVFNVKELPITSFYNCLRGRYNGFQFTVTESEFRAALDGYESWIAYLSGKMFKPDIVLMLHECLCGNRVIPPPPTPPPPPAAQDPNRRRQPPEDINGPGRTDGTSAGIGLPPPRASESPQYELLSDNDWDACKIFAAIFDINHDNANLKTSSQPTSADAPVNTKAGLAAKVVADLEILHGFFRDIAQQYYGKKYMIRMPAVMTYRDMDYAITPNGFLSLGDNFVLTIGGGKLYSNYEVSPEGAWEEYGNSIDDSIIIGSSTSYIFKDDNGLIQPILGFLADDHFDWESYAVCLDVKKNAETYAREGGKFYFYDLVKRAGILSSDRKTKYSSFNGGGCGDGGGDGDTNNGDNQGDTGSAEGETEEAEQTDPGRSPNVGD
jgi:hypothetical protein